MRTAVACGLVAVLGAALGGCAEKDPCERPFTCPETEVIDCMPPNPEGSPCLDGECLDWIRDHCPDVLFVY